MTLIVQQVLTQVVVMEEGAVIAVIAAPGLPADEGGEGGGSVDSVNGQTGVVVIDKADVGLSNVNDVAQIPASYLDTDAALAGNSDTKVPTQKAVKAYADQLIGAANAMVFKGVIDASANPNYPAGDAGWLFRISVAGKIGGAAGVNMEVGDTLLCLSDGTASGDQATVGSSWNLSQANMDGIVTGPASSTNNALARFSGTSGKVVKSSGIVIDDSNNVSGFGTIASGAIAITSNASASFAVGVNGATNPAFQVDGVAGAATGVRVIPAAAGAGVTLTALSSSANESMSIISKGFSNITFGAGAFAASIFAVGGVQRLNINTWIYAFDGISAQTSDLSSKFRYAGPDEATSSFANNAEAPNIVWTPSKGRRNHLGGGVIPQQREFLIAQTTHATGTAGTITNAATQALAGATISYGANTTIINSMGLWVQPAGVVSNSGVVTNSYGAVIEAQSGAANNYAAAFKGAAGEIFSLRTDGMISVLATNTVAGTTGAQTINKPAGRVNFAAGATSLVITNSLCTTASNVFAVVQGNDATAEIKNVVPSNGSFTINLKAAATAETPVSFFIIN